ncbi:helix-turn-helix domain-containing protein [Jidongwangia harbinensis]|uniref:helix-turn-helix domain-containing protein n=1 Tax=Jidongwangia harbinensis TaxID=2878561 RepID=UPI001CDA0728|nr:AraC family transcriptional regulator [Jidongwangia harbinensis]MCA2218817.1 AraC family transcriptional regulator [Jidongwangia harbinensis]
MSSRIAAQLHVERARRLVRQSAAREIIPNAPDETGRWLMHGYPDPVARWNHHPELEVHLLQYGSGWYIVGDRIGRYSAGQLVLVGPHLPHNWISDIDPGEHIADRDVVFQFHPQWVKDTQVLLPELATLEPLLLRAARGIEFAGPAAAHGAAELLAIGRSSGMARLRHITALLQTLADAPPAEYRLLAGPGITPPADSEATRIVDLAMREVFTNLNGTVSLTAIAARVGMSQSGFSRYFARATGQSFSDTLRKLRLAKARQLLEFTDDPIIAIAQASGYHNLSNFNRQFRLEHGLTPSEYRNRAGR